MVNTRRSSRLSQYNNENNDNHNNNINSDNENIHNYSKTPLKLTSNSNSSFEINFNNNNNNIVGDEDDDTEIDENENNNIKYNNQDFNQLNSSNLCTSSSSLSTSTTTTTISKSKLKSIRNINSSSIPQSLSLSLSTVRPRDPIEVQINLQIFRVHKIDSSSEEFTIDCGISFKWRDPCLIDKLNGISASSHPAIVSLKPRAKGKFDKWHPDMVVGETVFDPAWKILNTSDVKKITNISQVLDPNIGLVHNFIHVQATIFQTLNLKLFPFDHQVLTIRIQSEHVEGVMKFIPIDRVEPLIYQHQTASEWNVVQKSILANFDTSNYQQAASGARYVAMSYTFEVSRRPDWYISSVFLITYFIVTSSFSIYFIDSNQIGERLSILFTTWLMLISLKFIISDRLPKIAYLTLLDIFLGCSYLVMMLLILFVCFSPLSVLIWSNYCINLYICKFLYPENFTLGSLLTLWTIISYDTCLGKAKILALFQEIIINWKKTNSDIQLIDNIFTIMSNYIIKYLEYYTKQQNSHNQNIIIDNLK